MTSMRILLVTPVSPFGPSFGAQQRSKLFLDALAGMGQVDVAIVRSGTRFHVTRPADGVAVDVEWRPSRLGVDRYSASSRISRAVTEGLGRNLDTYDLVVGRVIGSMAKLHLPRGVPTLVDLDDICYRYADASMGWLKAMRFKWRSRLSTWLAEREMHRFSGAFFISRQDHVLFPKQRGWVLPNIAHGFDLKPDFAASGQTLLFVGALWYGPNRTGVDFFLRHCWPAIVRAEPGAKLLLAGAAPPAVRAEWERIPGVAAPGFVEDLAATYKSACFTVAPIYAGGGSNIKVIESFAHGRACVTTAFSMNGFREVFGDGTSLIGARDAQEMIEACLSLLRNPDEREARARLGHALTAQHFSRDRFSSIIAEAVASVMSANQA